jgi:hypothetical protein
MPSGEINRVSNFNTVVGELMGTPRGFRLSGWFQVPSSGPVQTKVPALLTRADAGKIAAPAAKRNGGNLRLVGVCRTVRREGPVCLKVTGTQLSEVAADCTSASA